MKRKAREYKDRRAVYVDDNEGHRMIGWIAEFHDGTFRCSSHESSPRFSTRLEARRWLEELIDRLDAQRERSRDLVSA